MTNRLQNVTVLVKKSLHNHLQVNCTGSFELQLQQCEIV